LPTFNQLVRTGRKTIEKKSKTPALLKGLNTKKNVVTDNNSPKSVAFVLLLRQLHLRSLTQLFVRLPEFVLQTELKYLLTFRALVITFRNTLLL
jgi:hypothetical protein